MSALDVLYCLILVSTSVASLWSMIVLTLIDFKPPIIYPCSVKDKFQDHHADAGPACNNLCRHPKNSYDAILRLWD